MSIIILNEGSQVRNKENYNKYDVYKCYWGWIVEKLVNVNLVCFWIKS